MARFTSLSLVWLFVVCLGCATGCQHCEFDLTRPEAMAAHVGTKADLVVHRDPLEYRFIAYENHLVAKIVNTSDDPIELLGPQSSAVDPKGQSHPLRGQSVAPHSFIKLILPPLHPHLDHSGPSIGIGLGFVADARRHRELGDAWLDDQEPRYLDVVDDDALYWDWDGETEVRLLLAFGRGDGRFTQEFVFRRVKG